MKHFIYILTILTLSSCSGLFVSNKSNLKDGNYILNLKIDSVLNPVRLRISHDPELKIVVINNTEEIVCDSISLKDDSLYFKLPIFNSLFSAKLISDSTFEGTWNNYHKGDDYKIPFHSSLQSTKPKKENIHSLGNWEVTFSKSTDDEYKAIGVFQRTSTEITGTFLTETGDYRFLQGEINGSKFSLSAFDGSHAFYFSGTFINDSTISNGLFMSGKHHKEPWEAFRNDTFKLKDANTLTFLKPGYDKFTFSFPDLDGKKVSIEDSQYLNKPVIIQIMGSWCPNCLDESKYLTKIYEQNHSKGLEIIALAYEAKDDFGYAKKRVETLKNGIGAKYDFLIAGTSDKEKASLTLPMLNHIMSFPTTIFLDKSHKVVQISTGFSGPSTGNEYLKYQQQTDSLIKTLLK